MDERTHVWTLGSLASMLGGELHGPSDLKLFRPVSADSGDREGIAFCESEAYLDAAEESGVGAVLLPRALPPRKLPAILVDNPRMAFGAILAMATKELPAAVGVHPTAVVDPTAQIGEGVSVGPYAVIEQGAVLGDGVKVFAFCYVGQNCKVGSRSILYPHATLYQDVVLGERCIVHSGAVIGADGFGFVWDGQRRVKIPHSGGVLFGNGVEIGANSTVDRSMVGNTRIGDGTKIDNLVMVGHNCVIGKHTVIASQVGIAGSSTIGDRCVFAGQAALSDHVKVTDDVTFAGRAATSQDITEPGEYFGAPALPIKQAIRGYLLGPKIPELFARMRKVERAIEKLGGDQ